MVIIFNILNLSNFLVVIISNFPYPFVDLFSLTAKRIDNRYCRSSPMKSFDSIFDIASGILTNSYLHSLKRDAGKLSNLTN